MTDLLDVLETYYDAAPRPNARVEEVGPLTLFVSGRADGFPYYARPRLGLTEAVTRAAVDAVRARQCALGVPEALEWVHETTPSLLGAALEAGLSVEECPLLVLRDTPVPSPEQICGTGIRVRLLDAGSKDLPQVAGAVHAGFGHTDVVQPRDLPRQRELMRAGLMVKAAAYDEDGAVVGGGSHGPRGCATELAGIAVLPRARRRGVGAAITATLTVDAVRRGIGT
ncbi:MAG: GNAT family N-acetyltransferase, partial [Nocardioidaceae bacterium]